MSKPVVVSGEASETDSEDEVFPAKIMEMTTSIQGAVVTGEDSESETENDGSICSAVSALQSDDVGDTKPNGSPHYDSLFHQRLKESNKKLHADIESYCNNVIDEASRTLSNVDQNLLRSQVTLQSAVTSLKSLGNNSLLLKNKLQSLLSANFIPNIKVEK